MPTFEKCLKISKNIFDFYWKISENGQKRFNIIFFLIFFENFANFCKAEKILFLNLNLNSRKKLKICQVQAKATKKVFLLWDPLDSTLVQI